MGIFGLHLTTGSRNGRRALVDSDKSGSGIYMIGFHFLFLLFQIFIPFATTPEPQAGAAWAWGQQVEDEKLLKIEWYYNYGTKGNPRIRAQFVPFLWCDRWPPHDYANGTNYFTVWRNQLANYRGYALILNEPDLPGSDSGGQCDRTPRQAAYIYAQARALCPSCVWVGPAVSDRDYRAGWPWLRQFYNELMGLGAPLPEVSAIHTYLAEDPRLIVDSHFALLAQFPGSAKTAWVTEFGHERAEVVNAMLAVWHGDARVTRWAYFAPRIPAGEGYLHKLTLVDDTGGLTALGRTWLKWRSVSK